MKTLNCITEGGPARTLLSAAMIMVCFLVSSCASGYDASLDMDMAIASGEIEKQEKISAHELQEILVSHFGRVIISVTDDEYVLPDNGKVAQLSRSVFLDPVGGNSGRHSGWDCDDYAIAALLPLRSYAFGVMFVTTASGVRHALNVFVNYKKEVIYWEPQTRQYYQGQFHRPELIIF